VHGYEIHHGVLTRDGGEPFFADEGCRAGAVSGTIWHGLLENDEFRRRYLADVARLSGRRFTGAPDVSFAGVRAAKLDRLADLIDGHLDQHAIRDLLTAGCRGAPPLRLMLGG
jgi:adenosylcobyric acid synthase